MVNFAQGEFMMLGAFLAATFVSVMDLHFALGIVLALLLMSLVGALMSE